MPKTILVTGSAGFIGFHTAKKLLERGDSVIGIDNFNDYYNPQIKEDRNKILEKFENFKLYRGDISDIGFLDDIFSGNMIDVVCHLAAQAGVRYSIENPFAYERANMLGTLNIFEMCRKHNIHSVVYASSSSVYGNTKQTPFNEDMKLDKPISLYAATKKANELYAYVYHHLYGIKMVGLRFFTVYGPWGRPDMAYFAFTDSIINNRPVKIFNRGNQRRDFTYIDDIRDGIISSIDKIHEGELNYEIFNLGNSTPENLLDFMGTIESALGKTAVKEMVDAQPGDVTETFADITKSKAMLNYNPKTPLSVGIPKFIEWYKDYFKVN
jgi:UDP-glucuronate 4-epimerase